MTRLLQQAERKSFPQANSTSPEAQGAYLPRFACLLHTVEHWAQLRQPLSVHSGHALHVLLRGEEQQGRGREGVMCFSV